jgi:hypothetical protein
MTPLKLYEICLKLKTRQWGADWINHLVSLDPFCSYKAFDFDNQINRVFNSMNYRESAIASLQYAYEAAGWDVSELDRLLGLNDAT